MPGLAVSHGQTTTPISWSVRRLDISASAQPQMASDPQDAESANKSRLPSDRRGSLFSALWSRGTRSSTTAQFPHHRCLSRHGNLRHACLIGVAMTVPAAGWLTHSYGATRVPSLAGRLPFLSMSVCNHYSGWRSVILALFSFALLMIAIALRPIAPLLGTLPREMIGAARLIRPCRSH